MAHEAKTEGGKGSMNLNESKRRRSERETGKQKEVNSLSTYSGASGIDQTILNECDYANYETHRAEQRSTPENKNVIG
jgi:hypothetical protein